MKYLLIATALAFITCCKKTETNPLDAEFAKLPPITSTGANTFGCLVNGKAVTPNSSCLGCPPPLIADFDNSSNGNFGITCNYEEGNKKVLIGVDSIFTYKKAIINNNLNKNVRVALFDRNVIDSCQVTGYLTGVGTFTSIIGEVNFERIDVPNGIFSGTFNFNIKTKSCGNYEVTNGRFDYKF
jgi:hypothetical protein